MMEFCIYIKAFSQFILWPYWHCTFACIMWFCVHCTHCLVPPFLLASFTVELEIATCTIPDYRFNMNIFLYWRYNDDSRGFHFLRSVSSFSLSRVVYNFKSFKSIHWPFEHIYLLFRFVLFEFVRHRHLWLAWNIRTADVSHLFAFLIECLM